MPRKQSETKRKKNIILKRTTAIFIQHILLRLKLPQSHRAYAERLAGNEQSPRRGSSNSARLLVAPQTLE